MKKIAGVILLLCVISGFMHGTIQPTLGFDKVVIWGHKLHSHTHSYIHWAFNRAFQHLGYQTYWLDNSDDIKKLDLSNALFITEGKVDQRIPVREDCWYIVHNCAMNKYQRLLEKGRCIILQVYTHDCIKRGDTQIAPCMYYDLPGKTIYLPWATDLLPHEIDAQKKLVASRVKRRTTAYFVGTITKGKFGNAPAVAEFKRACKKNCISFMASSGCSMEDNIRQVFNSFVAPSIQGRWQAHRGYIPCRIFKNISYGQLGVTNSAAVYELFNKKIVYNPDCYQLFYDAKRKLEHLDLADLVRVYSSYFHA